MKYRIGVDTGGTFTDLVAIDEEGKVKVVKSSSTPRDPSDAVENALVKSRIDLRDVEVLVHGSTVGINTVIQNRGVKTAILTTKGFRDILELRRGRRVIDRPQDMYNLQMDLPQDYVGGYHPLVERQHRFEIVERLDYRGTVLTPLDEESVRDAARQCRAKGVESVAVVFFFSFINPAHELRTKEILEKELPGVPVSLSCEILPVIREYERTSTTAVNAYIMPIMQNYLRNLGNRVARLGCQKEFFVMQSAGGVMSAEMAGQRPVYTVDSGPAAGVVASAELGNKIGYPNVIVFDMGGTTAKVCVIKDGLPAVTNNFWVDGKYFIGAPVMDMVEIGAGGGSMAWVDNAGVVHVGPQSAGADPGPACYGWGGTHPTVCDVDLVLGYINKDYFLGGEMKVDVPAARKAIREIVADKVGMDITDAANGIYRIVNANMISAMRIVTIQRGYDPRDFCLMVSGGTAAIHACRMAQELRIPTVVCPLMPGAFSAYGLITADSEFTSRRSHLVRTDFADAATIQHLYQILKKESVEKIKELGFQEKEIKIKYEIDMRYCGQAHEVVIALEDEIVEVKMDKWTIAEIEKMFHKRHEELFGHASPEFKVEIVTLSAKAIGPNPKGKMHEIEVGATDDPKQAFKGLRQVYFDEYKDYRECKTYDRYKLQANNIMMGPVVIEQADTTIVIPPDVCATVDRYGNVIIDIEPQKLQ